MPTTVTCPNCNRALRVPDELLGKRVKCPACATVMTTSVGGAAAPPEGEAIVRERRPPGPEEEEPRPPQRRRTEPEDEEGELPDEESEEEEEERPRRRRWRFRSSRQRARDEVAAPAIALIVLGAIYMCVALLFLVLHLIQASLGPQAPPQQRADPAFQLGEKVGRTVAPVIDIVGICLGGIMILGGVQMKGLKSYGYALTGIISGMLPCHCCFLVGIGFGIWSLVVINRPEVKSAFG